MSVQEFEENKCRICLENNEELDWNNLIYNHSHLTYRDCFFKYTQLACINEDHFSNMICHNCSNGLEYIDTFISRAIETNAKLQEMFFLGSLNDEGNTELSPADFDTIYVEEIEIKKEEEGSILYEEGKTLWLEENPLREVSTNQKEEDLKTTNNINNVGHDLNNSLSDERKYFTNEAEKETRMKTSISETVIEETVDTTKFTILVRQLRKYMELSNSSSSTKSKKRNKKKSLAKNLNKEKLTECCKSNPLQIKPDETYENYFEKLENPSDPFTKLISNKMSDTKPIVVVNSTKTNKTKEKRFLCQYCSAEIKGWSKLKEHEAKHNQVRKRTETCAQCGVKFYNKKSLRMHEQTHDVNREKKFKCEFCEKAFFNMGALNIHRRIHLGLMVKCQICSKEFFRNVELYKHMNIHSSTSINVEVKKRSRYFVRCKHCGKKILSASFKSHTAAHLNQPLVKCSICNKEYFNRESCRHHIRTIHKKKPETVNDYVVVLKTDRLTHLYIRQNADIEAEEE